MVATHTNNNLWSGNLLDYTYLKFQGLVHKCIAKIPEYTVVRAAANSLRTLIANVSEERYDYMHGYKALVGLLNGSQYQALDNCGRTYIDASCRLITTRCGKIDFCQSCADSKGQKLSLRFEDKFDKLHKRYFVQLLTIGHRANDFQMVEHYRHHEVDQNATYDTASEFVKWLQNRNFISGYIHSKELAVVSIQEAKLHPHSHFLVLVDRDLWEEPLMEHTLEHCRRKWLSGLRKRGVVTNPNNLEHRLLMHIQDPIETSIDFAKCLRYLRKPSNFNKIYAQEIQDDFGMDRSSFNVKASKLLQTIIKFKSKIAMTMTYGGAFHHNSSDKDSEDFVYKECPTDEQLTIIARDQIERNAADIAQSAVAEISSTNTTSTNIDLQTNTVEQINIQTKDIWSSPDYKVQTGECAISKTDSNRQDISLCPCTETSYARSVSTTYPPPK